MSTTGSSAALSSFEKTHPLEGPPSEWLCSDITRCADRKDMKDKIAGWDKEWERLAGKVRKE